MTNKDLKKVRVAFGPLIQFLGLTHHDAEWHNTRQRLWAHAEEQLAVLVEVPEPEPAPEPE